MPVKTPDPKGAKVDSRLSISRGKQDGRYHAVTRDADLPIRLLVMRDGRPPHQQVRAQVDKSLSKVRGILTNDLSRAVHVWAGKVIAYYKYTTLKEMKVFVEGANKSDLFKNPDPGLDEKQAIFTAFWDNYHPQNAEKVFLWVARFIQFKEPLSGDGIMPPGSFWVKTFFVNLAVKTKLHLDAPDDPDSSWPDLQGFFDTFPQKHPVHHKVRISDFKIRADPKTVRHSQYLYGPPTPDDDSVVVVHSAAAKTAAAVKNGIATATGNTTITTTSSSGRKVVKESASSTRRKRVYKRQRLSSKWRSVREMSILSNMTEFEGKICGVSSSCKTPIKQSSHQQGRINEIEQGSAFDKMSITEYVLQSSTVQTMLMNEQNEQS